MIGDPKHASLEKIEDIEDQTFKKRALHLVSENQRVKKRSACLREGDLDTLGKLIDESHESLSALYEVSLPEIDRLVTSLPTRRSVLGAPLLGAGFGSWVLVLFEKEEFPCFENTHYLVKADEGPLIEQFE